MTDRELNARIQWGDKTIQVYLDDRLAERAFDIARGIADEADQADTKDELRLGVNRVALANDLEVVTFAADGSHLDPLETLVTVGLRPQSPPVDPLVD